MKKINYNNYIKENFVLQNDDHVEEVILNSQYGLKDIVIINCPNLNKLVIKSNTVQNILINFNKMLKDASIITQKAKIVQLHQNKIANLKLNTPNVVLIDLTDNCLTQFNYQNLNSLKTLLLRYNKLQKLEIDYPKLRLLRVDDNRLDSLNISSKTINEISCNNNQIYDPVICMNNLSRISTETPIFFTKKNNMFDFCKYHNINYSFLQKTAIDEVLF